jgi:hypothetical protein
MEHSLLAKSYRNTTCWFRELRSLMCPVPAMFVPSRNQAKPCFPSGIGVSKVMIAIFFTETRYWSRTLSQRGINRIGSICYRRFRGREVEIIKTHLPPILWCIWTLIWLDHGLVQTIRVVECERSSPLERVNGQSPHGSKRITN